jgi:hypothetical protein
MVGGAGVLRRPRIGYRANKKTSHPIFALLAGGNGTSGLGIATWVRIVRRRGYSFPIEFVAPTRGVANASAAPRVQTFRHAAARPWLGCCAAGRATLLARRGRVRVRLLHWPGSVKRPRSDSGAAIATAIATSQLAGERQNAGVGHFTAGLRCPKINYLERSQAALLNAKGCETSIFSRPSQIGINRKHFASNGR